MDYQELTRIRVELEDLKQKLSVLLDVVDNHITKTRKVLCSHVFKKMLESDGHRTHTYYTCEKCGLSSDDW